MSWYEELQRKCDTNVLLSNQETKTDENQQKILSFGSLPNMIFETKSAGICIGILMVSVASVALVRMLSIARGG